MTNASDKTKQWNRYALTVSLYKTHYWHGGALCHLLDPSDMNCNYTYSNFVLCGHLIRGSVFHPSPVLWPFSSPSPLSPSLSRHACSCLRCLLRSLDSPPMKLRMSSQKRSPFVRLLCFGSKSVSLQRVITRVTHRVS